MAYNPRMLVLLVDDSHTMRSLIRRILRQLQFKNIYEAEDGVEAWRMLQTLPVEFIISDWNMPNMTGIDFLKKVRADERFAHLPFLMVTGEAQKDNVLEAVKAKVSHYIVKPFNAHTLEGRIEKIFSQVNTEGKAPPTA